MKLSIHFGILFVLSLFVISGLTLAVSATTTTSAVTSTLTTTTTSSSIKTLVFKGHSPVDMEVCYNSATTVPPGFNACTTPTVIKIGIIKQPAIIGCTAECTPISHIIYLAVFSLSPLSIATFTGPSGTGCNTESSKFTETITITNAPPGTYTLKLVPSVTFSASKGPGCPGTGTTLTTYGYTITVTDVNTETMTGFVSPASCTSDCISPPPPSTGSVSSTGTVSFSDFFVTPVFPIGTILAIVVPLLAFVTYVVINAHMPRKKGILPVPR